ncbi:outer membrane lipoprotein-sorting protein [Chitinophaga skermanii]|uniref:Outer membrane lipoprotein-sorting protein n=1 Tax=Chitinophaga skermanii TaxID=331697 RepID=A0A327QF35_9BACT|nr:outer membrane lipoprotein carrier protein LolA [Chitinophaga skermanii]RAJ02605.1 outer membrane lipoprotein-sorting protein [Chitinophaga skermanii]
MRKIVAFAAICMLFTMHAFAQNFKPVANTAAFNEQFSKASQNIKSIKSDFVQEKNLTMLSDKIVSKGKFWFKKDNKVKMEYLTPTYYLMVINGKNIKVKDSKKENKISTSQSKIFQKVSKITADCVQGNVLNSADFKSKVLENAQYYNVELTPTDKNISTYFKTIDLWVDKKDYAVVKIVMHDTSGDDVTMTFVNREMNVNIPDEVFAVN